LKLSGKIFMASLLPFLVIATAYHYLATSLFSDYLIDNYRQQVSNRLYHIEEDILHFLGEDERELRTLLKREPPDPKNPDQTRRTLNNFLYHDDSLVLVSAITTNGREWLRLSKFPDSTNSDNPKNLFYDPVYQKPMLEMEPYFDFLKIGPDFALPFFDLSIPFKNRQTGRISGVLWLRTYSQPAQDILENYLPTSGKIMLIRSENGEVILQADDTRQDFASSERQAIRKIANDNRANGWLESDQATFLYRKFAFNGLGMTLIYYQPHKNIYYLADRLRTYNLRVALIGVGLFILASFILIKITISPLTRITEQITKLSYRYRLAGAGQDEQTEKQATDEIKQLLESFSLLKTRLSAYRNGMETEIKTRKQTEEELREIQEQLEERIKERTQALEKTHAQLLHAEKLATSGSMAASIAHEFGNPLCGIKAVLTSVAQQDALPAADSRMVSMALDECDRMNSLMQNLKDFNRPSSGEKTLTNLPRVIDDIVVFSRGSLERNAIAVEKDYDLSLPPIMVITDQIKQVIMNLINNSIDACNKGGVIAISTRKEEANAVIRVSDNGKGIKQDDLSRIFDPFFTTKPVAMGTGLGLSVSYGIIRRHGGTIEVSSKVDEGSTFTIILPIEDKDDE
jgi:signal transduction histidine kinase